MAKLTPEQQPIADKLNAETKRKAEAERKARALEWVAQNMPELLIIRDLERDRKRGRSD
jgi:hypothetical protein